jgi:glycine cleavage system H protein
VTLVSSLVRGVADVKGARIAVLSRLDIIIASIRIGEKLEGRMKILKDLRYTKEHEWVKLEGDVATMGITDYAQEQLSDIVFLELPDAGTAVEKMKPIGTIEAVKAVTDVYAPVSGEVVETNDAVKESPGTINQDPYGAGWMIKIKVSDSGEFEKLMSSEDYEKLLGEAH